MSSKSFTNMGEVGFELLSFMTFFKLTPLLTLKMMIFLLFTEELEELVHLVGPVIKKCWMSAGSSSSGPGARPTPQSMGLFGARQNFIWSHDALKTLYHFIRCSQLEYVGQEGRAPIQVLKGYELFRVQSNKSFGSLFRWPTLMT